MAVAVFTKTGSVAQCLPTSALECRILEIEETSEVIWASSPFHFKNLVTEAQENVF